MVKNFTVIKIFEARLVFLFAYIKPVAQASHQLHHPEHWQSGSDGPPIPRRDLHLRVARSEETFWLPARRRLPLWPPPAASREEGMVELELLRRRSRSRRGRRRVAEDDSDGWEVPAAGLPRSHLLRRGRPTAVGGAHTALRHAEPLSVLQRQESGHRRPVTVISSLSSFCGW